MVNTNANDISNKAVPFTYKGYSATIWYDKNENVFRGRVEGITEDISFQGSSIKELDKEFKFFVDTYIVECEHLDIKPEKQFSGSVTAKIPSDIHCRLNLLCKEINMSVEEFVEAAVTFAMKMMEDDVSDTRIADELENVEYNDKFLDLNEFKFPLFYKGYGAIMHKMNEEIPYKALMLNPKTADIDSCFMGKTVRDVVYTFRRYVDDIIENGAVHGPFDGNVVFETDPRIQYILSVITHMAGIKENEYLTAILIQNLKEEYDVYSICEPDIIENTIMSKK